MSSWWKSALPFLARHRAALAGVLLLSLLSIAFNLALPWPMKLIVDHVLAEKPYPANWLWLPGAIRGGDRSTQLALLALASAGLFLLVRLAETARVYLSSRIGRGMQYELGASLFLRLQQLSPAFHARASAGDLVRRIVLDSKCVDEFFIGICIPALTALVMLGTMFAVMAAMSWPIALLAFLMSLPIAALVRAFIPKITEQTLHQQNLDGQVMALAETNLAARPVVHAFDRTEVEGARFRLLAGQSIAALAEAVARERLFGILVGLSIASGTATVFGLGGFEVMNGTLELGSLLIILTYLGLLYAPVDTLARLAAAFAHSAAKGRRAFAVLSEREMVRDPPVRAHTPERAAGAIRFENVSFAYDEGHGGVRNVNLVIHPGETIAIVGPTGAGKSTLVSLVLRLFDPEEGRITLDGIDLRDWKLEDLRRQFGLVLQDPFLLPLTVKENIAFTGDAAVDRVAAATRAASADDFIRKLPEGYDSRLGERGTGLSGGEKQRIAIARAFFRDAPVLILDEPTSALDIETEHILLESIYPARRDRTTIIIAHRLSTIRGADRIVLLEEGEVIESGTHIELVAHRGRYFRLHQQSLSPD
jgi:ATP-binding cassette subfamily B protein/subfamily B ATP-binding cassette protein MsbA